MPDTATREKPILFSTPMVKALLAGKKTQTRRLCKQEPLLADLKRGTRLRGPDEWTAENMDYWCSNFCPYKVGQTLWVRETFACRVDFDPKDDPEKARQYCLYKASGDDIHDEMHWHDYGDRWRSPIHMSRCLSRINLHVTDVRCQRLQEISEADAIAEGIMQCCPADLGWSGGIKSVPAEERTPVKLFAQLWDKINGKGSWEQNPWTWAISFTVEVRK